MSKTSNLSSFKNTIHKAGSFIKEARVSRNISVEELSENLRIGKEQLMALENGDMNKLPEMVFIKAMIRRISEKLNIEMNFIFEELNSSNTQKLESLKIKEDLPNSYTKNLHKRNSKIKTLTIIIVSSLLAISASVYTINYVNNIEIESNQ